MLIKVKDTVGSIAFQIVSLLCLALFCMHNECCAMEQVDEMPTLHRYSKCKDSAKHIISICQTVKPIIEKDPAIRRELPPAKIEFDISEIIPLRNSSHHSNFSYPEIPAELQINGDVMIVGDIHGDLMSLAICLSKFEQSQTLKVLFLGDYVDRGPYSLEVMSLLFELKVKYPDRIFLIRGNHEKLEPNEISNFRIECIQKYARYRDKGIKSIKTRYISKTSLAFQKMINLPSIEEQLSFPSGLQVFEAITSVWDVMPKRAVVNGKFFCVHGGIPCYFKEMDNPKSPYFEKIEEELLWNDPIDPSVVWDYDDIGFIPSKRGILSKRFGGRAVKSFIEWKKIEYPELSYIVRAHETKEKPDEIPNVFTIFSSRYYCNPDPFSANVMNIKPDGTYDFERLGDIEIRNSPLIFTFLQSNFGLKLIEDMRDVKLLPICYQLQNFRLYENSVLSICLDLNDQLKSEISSGFIKSFTKLERYFPILRDFLDDLENYSNYLHKYGYMNTQDGFNVSQETIHQIREKINPKRPPQIYPLRSKMASRLTPTTFTGKGIFGSFLKHSQNTPPRTNINSIKDDLDPILMKIGLHMPSFYELQDYPSILWHLLDQFEEEFPDEPTLIPEFNELDTVAKFFNRLSNSLKLKKH